MLDRGFYGEDELRDAGFRSIGTNVQIEKGCTVVGKENISIKDNVRIYGFCTIVALGGSLEIGSFVHIGAYSHLLASGGLSIEDFVGFSQAVRIYSRSDDYSGESLNGPMVPQEYAGYIDGPVTIGRHALLGSGVAVLPNVKIGEGVAVGAQSLVTRDLDEWSIYAGSPAQRVRERSRELLAHEAEMISKGIYKPE